MADLTYCTFKEFGDDAFCIRDYRGIKRDPKAQGKILGLILDHKDTETTVGAFTRIAKEMRPEIIMVELSYLEADSSVHSYELSSLLYSYLDSLLDNGYEDLMSYEHRLCYGKVTEQ